MTFDIPASQELFDLHGSMWFNTRGRNVKTGRYSTVSIENALPVVALASPSFQERPSVRFTDSDYGFVKSIDINRGCRLHSELSKQVHSAASIRICDLGTVGP